MHLKVLFHKNFRIWKRTPLLSFFEIFLPICCALMLALIFNLSLPHNKPDNFVLENHFKANQDMRMIYLGMEEAQNMIESFCPGFANKESIIALIPKNSFTELIKTELENSGKIPSQQIVFMQSNSHLDEYILNLEYGNKEKQKDKICFALVFDSSWEDIYSYQIRTNATTFPIPQKSSIYSSRNEHIANFQDSLSNGMGWIMNMISNIILKQEGKGEYTIQSNGVALIQSSNYKSTFYSLIRNQSNLFVLLPLALSFLRMTYFQLQEKQGLFHYWIGCREDIFQFNLSWALLYSVIMPVIALFYALPFSITSAQYLSIFFISFINILLSFGLILQSLIIGSIFKNTLSGMVCAVLVITLQVFNEQFLDYEKIPPIALGFIVTIPGNASSVLYNAIAKFYETINDPSFFSILGQQLYRFPVYIAFCGYIAFILFSIGICYVIYLCQRQTSMQQKVQQQSKINDNTKQTEETGQQQDEQLKKQIDNSKVLSQNTKKQKKEINQNSSPENDSHDEKSDSDNIPNIQSSKLQPDGSNDEAITDDKNDTKTKKNQIIQNNQPSLSKHNSSDPNENIHKSVISKTKKKQIILKNIKKLSSKEIILNQISCTIEEGVFQVGGEYHCGKSSLIRIISAVEKPHSGEVSFVNTEQHKQPIGNVTSGVIGIVFQEQFLLEQLTVKEHLELAQVFYNKESFNDLDINEQQVETQQKNDNINNILFSLGLSSLMNVRCEDLSVSKRQCLAIAIAFSGEKEIIVLDEVFENMTQDDLRLFEIFIAEQKKQHKIIIITSNIDIINQQNYNNNNNNSGEAYQTSIYQDNLVIYGDTFGLLSEGFLDIPKKNNRKKRLSDLKSSFSSVGSKFSNRSSSSDKVRLSKEKKQIEITLIWNQGRKKENYQNGYSEQLIKYIQEHLGDIQVIEQTGYSLVLVTDKNEQAVAKFLEKLQVLIGENNNQNMMFSNKQKQLKSYSNISRNEPQNTFKNPLATFENDNLTIRACSISLRALLLASTRPLPLKIQSTAQFYHPLILEQQKDPVLYRNVQSKIKRFFYKLKDMLDLRLQFVSGYILSSILYSVTFVSLAFFLMVYHNKAYNQILEQPEIFTINKPKIQEQQQEEQKQLLTNQNKLPKLPKVEPPISQLKIDWKIFTSSNSLFLDSQGNTLTIPSNSNPSIIPNEFANYLIHDSNETYFGVHLLNQPKNIIKYENYIISSNHLSTLSSLNIINEAIITGILNKAISIQVSQYPLLMTLTDENQDSSSNYSLNIYDKWLSAFILSFGISISFFILTARFAEIKATIKHIIIHKSHLQIMIYHFTIDLFGFSLIIGLYSLMAEAFNQLIIIRLILPQLFLSAISLSVLSQLLSILAGFNQITFSFSLGLCQGIHFFAGFIYFSERAFNITPVISHIFCILPPASLSIGIITAVLEGYSGSYSYLIHSFVSTVLIILIVIWLKRKGSNKMIEFIKKIDKDYAFSKQPVDESIIKASMQDIRHKQESIFKEEFNVEETQNQNNNDIDCDETNDNDNNNTNNCKGLEPRILSLIVDSYQSHKLILQHLRRYSSHHSLFIDFLCHPQKQTNILLPAATIQLASSLLISNLSYQQHLYFYGTHINASQNVIESVLTTFGLQSVSRKKIKDSSFDFQIRLSIAIGLLVRPQIIIFDSRNLVSLSNETAVLLFNTLNYLKQHSVVVLLNHSRFQMMPEDTRLLGIFKTKQGGIQGTQFLLKSQTIQSSQQLDQLQQYIQLDILLPFVKIEEEIKISKDMLKEGISIKGSLKLVLFLEEIGYYHLANQIKLTKGEMKLKQKMKRNGIKTGDIISKGERRILKEQYEEKDKMKERDLKRLDVSKTDDIEANKKDIEKDDNEEHKEKNLQEQQEINEKNLKIQTVSEIIPAEEQKEQPNKSIKEPFSPPNISQVQPSSPEDEVTLLQYLQKKCNSPSGISGIEVIETIILMNKQFKIIARLRLHFNRIHRLQNVSPYELNLLVSVSSFALAKNYAILAEMQQSLPILTFSVNYPTIQQLINVKALVKLNEKRRQK